MESYDRINYLIQELGLNVTSFSKKIGISNNMTIGRIIREKRNPSYETIQLIMNTFNINANWIFTGKGDIFQNKTEQRLINIEKSINQIINKIDEIHKK
jgi:transcriptional regulator with XRE-family HTH domain